jgi:hypothetical protein
MFTVDAALPPGPTSALAATTPRRILAAKLDGTPPGHDPWTASPAAVAAPVPNSSADVPPRLPGAVHELADAQVGAPGAPGSGALGSSPVLFALLLP